MARSSEAGEGTKPSKHHIARLRTQYSQHQDNQPLKQWKLGTKRSRPPDRHDDSSDSRSSHTAGCAFCETVSSANKRKTYEDDHILAFPVSPAQQAAQEHIIVTSKEHIKSTRHLQNSDEHLSLVHNMYDVGRQLLLDRNPQSGIQFNFVEPPFGNRQELHLHLHCFGLPFKSFEVAAQYAISPYATLGSSTPEQVLERLESLEPVKRRKDKQA